MAQPELTFSPRPAERPIEVAAGPVRLTIENGAVRWVGLHGVEIVHGIYGAVRDAGWGTIEPRFESYEAAIEDEAFELRFRAACVREADGIDFAWTGTISGSRDGTIRFEFDGIARRPFMATRIGLCVLHPLRQAGRPVEVTTLFGRLRGNFPELITGYMPFSNVREIRQDPGRRHETLIEFAGDVFQMEDQRAFTDASFKTFSRPLELPQPYQVDAGTAVRQTVTIAVPRWRTPSRRKIAAASQDRPAVLRLGARLDRPFPAVGSGLEPADVAPSSGVTAAIRHLGLAHLRATIVVGDTDASAEVRRAVTAAREADCALEVVLLMAPTDPGVERLLAEIAASKVPVARIIGHRPCWPCDLPGTGTPRSLGTPRGRSSLLPWPVVPEATCTSSLPRASPRISWTKSSTRRTRRSIRSTRPPSWRRSRPCR